MRSDLSFAWRLAVFSICAIFEAFKVVDGKIRQIEATVFSVPYKMNPGWPDE